jgi:hypothetical protein
MVLETTRNIAEATGSTGMANGDGDRLGSGDGKILH